MTELIGRTLGQYQIIEQIGRGGMATVFKAYQPGLDRYVALKILSPAHAQQPGFADRFVREAKAIARLNHPNIVPVFDFGHIDGLSFLVMRYIDLRKVGGGYIFVHRLLLDYFAGLDDTGETS
jgi:serine/threonine protein kinase